MDYGLRDKVALVTGASKGLAKASAMALAREGASVVICSRDEASIEAAAADIRTQTGAAVLATVADVSTVEGVNHAVAAAMHAFGRVDILVASAGGPPTGFLEKLSDADWYKGIELTLLGAMRLIRAVGPGMRQRKWGRIVYISSTTIKEPIGNLILSNSLRSAVVAALKTYSREAAPDGVTVNNVAPGRFDTDRVRWLDTQNAQTAGVPLEQEQRRSAATIPAGRYGTPEEFGDAVCFLCSDAARYITGVTLQVDGGKVQSMF